MANIVEFTAFLRDRANIPTTALPDSSSIIPEAYTWGIAIVPCEFNCAGTNVYDLAVYCAGTSYIINWAVDQPNMSYFTNLRKDLGIGTFTGGVIANTFDNGSGNSRTTPDWVKNATVSDLQYLKDPFGLQLLGILQRYGSLWGLS